MPDIQNSVISPWSYMRGNRVKLNNIVVHFYVFLDLVQIEIYINSFTQIKVSESAPSETIAIYSSNTPKFLPASRAKFLDTRFMMLN